MIEILWTDALVFLLVFAIIGFALYARSREHLRAPWREVVKKPLGMSALIILMVYVIIGLLDSLHYRPVLEKTSNNSSQPVQYAAASYFFSLNAL